MKDLSVWLASCSVCPHACGADRLSGGKGKCRTGPEIRVSSANLHFGEEPVLVGSGGSGTIFFTSCNLSCVFCQNYDISTLDYGKTITENEFISIMTDLARKGAENINLVSPTHVAPQVFEAVKKAKAGGLGIPVVYNCGGYENPEFLEEIDGLVDIYMPDFKYGRDEEAELYSGTRGYVARCEASLLEMQRQVGSLSVNARGVATIGLLIRHLVLPNDAAHSKEVIDFIASRLPPDTFVNVMDQYRPCYRAAEFHDIERRVYAEEVREVVEYARRKGLTRVMR